MINDNQIEIQYRYEEITTKPNWINILNSNEYEYEHSLSTSN